MTYRNGYTSTQSILAMKKEIRKIKIDINRLMVLTLDYADEITTNDMNKGRLPKPIDHIFTAVKHMNDHIEELALKIKRERNKISDANPTKNRKYLKANRWLQYHWHLTFPCIFEPIQNYFYCRKTFLILY